MMLSFKILMQHHYWLRRFLMNGNLSLTLFPGSLFFPSSPLGAPLGCSRGHEEDTETPGMDPAGVEGDATPSTPPGSTPGVFQGADSETRVIEGDATPSTLPPGSTHGVVHGAGRWLGLQRWIQGGKRVEEVTTPLPEWWILQCKCLICNPHFQFCLCSSFTAPHRGSWWLITPSFLKSLIRPWSLGTH